MASCPAPSRPDMASWQGCCPSRAIRTAPGTAAPTTASSAAGAAEGAEHGIRQSFRVLRGKPLPWEDGVHKQRAGGKVERDLDVGVRGSSPRSMARRMIARLLWRVEPGSCWTAWVRSGELRAGGDEFGMTRRISGPARALAPSPM